MIVRHVEPGRIAVVQKWEGREVNYVVIGRCSGLMKPDTHLGENARQIEVSDDQATSFLFNQSPAVSAPISHIFTVAPNIDTETLLVHVSETLASLNAITTDLAFELEGSRRHVALAMQQLVVLGELLVNRALEHLDVPDAGPGTCH